MRTMTVITTVLLCAILLAPQLWAKTFYLRNGEEIEYQSYRKQKNLVSVLINRDTEVGFAPDEVNWAKTVKAAREAGSKKKMAGQKSYRKQTASSKASGAKAVGTFRQNPVAAIAAPAVEPLPAGSTVTKEAAPTLRSELAAIYHDYHKAVLSGDLDAIMKFVTREKRQEMEGMLAQADASQKAMLMQMMQAMVPTDYAVTGSALTSDGESATLSLKGSINFMGNHTQSEGTVSFKREGNTWRINKESWRAQG